MLILTSLIIIIGLPMFFIWLHNGIEEIRHHSLIINEAQDIDKRIYETARLIVKQNQKLDGHEWPNLDKWDIHHIYRDIRYFNLH